MEKSNFDHGKESLAEAAGVNVEALNEKISNAIDKHNEKGEGALSELVETMVYDFTPVELALMAVHWLSDQTKSPAQLLMEALKSDRSEN